MSPAAGEAGWKPKKDDRVVLKPEYARDRQLGRVYVVDRLLPKNIDCRPEDGVGKGMRAPAYMLEPAPEPGAGGAVVTTVPYVAHEFLNEGRVVTVAGPGWRRPAGELCVVLVDRGDKVKLTVLGGLPNGGYWPSVPRSWITPVTGTVGILPDNPDN